MAPETLSNEALNRAILARQHLLTRTRDSIPKVVEHLLGLQAQEPMDPYPALWSRLSDFDPDELGRLVEKRKLVRLTLMRGTLHLVTVRDAWALRGLIQPVLDRLLRGWWVRGLGGADTEEVAAIARKAYAKAPMTYAELGKFLAAKFPASSAESLARTVQVRVPLIQAPPRGVWQKSGAAKHTPLEPVRTSRPTVNLEKLVLRYLAAFGPAAVQDMQSWSGLTKLNVVFEKLEPKLVQFKSPTGKTLYDLPNAPRPAPDVHAPPRLLPVFDNVTLGLKDRARMFRPGIRLPTVPANSFVRYALIDGTHGATWFVRGKGKDATMIVKPFVRISSEQRHELRGEAESLLRMYAPEAKPQAVRIEKG